MEKLDRPLDVFEVDEGAPQGLEDSVLEVDALLQSMAPLVVL